MHRIECTVRTANREGFRLEFTSTMSTAETDSELVERVDALLLSIRQRIDERAPSARDDIVEADELYGFLGQIEASLRAAAEHAAWIRETLVHSVKA